MNAEKKPRDIFDMKEIRDLLDVLARPIAFRRALVDLTGSVQAALMLSQAIYWQERANQKDGWWYKSIEEWQEETGLTRRRLETARKKNRKYLSSNLRDIPARLYWKVNHEELRRDLWDMHDNKYYPSQEVDPAQFGEIGESSLADADHQLDRNQQTRMVETDDQPGGNAQTELTESSVLVDSFYTNINKYTENTTKSTTETKTEKLTESNSKMEEVEAETETEKEKEQESYHYCLHRLIQSCILVFPEETPADVESIIKLGAEMFQLEWIRDAVNEAVRRNDRHLRAVMEILDAWKVKGHTVTSGKKVAGFTRIEGSASH